MIWFIRQTFLSAYYLPVIVLEETLIAPNLMDLVGGKKTFIEIPQINK